ncbi:MAG: heme-dependent oxidative N-demethylase family protein [Pseudomonadota bacterium]
MSRPAWTLGRVPVAPFAEPRKAVAPGVGALDPAEWLFPAEDFAGQMAERDRLILEHPGWAYDTRPEGEDAAAELLEAVVEEVTARHGAAREDGAVRRPDGVRVPLEGPAIATAGRLAQEDFLLLDKPEGAAEHVLVAGVLCFPARWVLAEKMGRALVRIHRPVPGYAEGLASRVQRLFDGVKVGRPLWRANWHFAAGPEIVTPMAEADKDPEGYDRAEPDADLRWLRVERQTVLRLPRTQAVVFGVRTLMSPVEALTREQWRALDATLRQIPEGEGAAKLTPALRARAAREATESGEDARS